MDKRKSVNKKTWRNQEDTNRRENVLEKHVVTGVQYHDLIDADTKTCSQWYPQLPVFNLKRPTSSFQPPASNLQLPIFNLKRPTSTAHCEF